jgi:hypothetical protein
MMSNTERRPATYPLARKGSSGQRSEHPPPALPPPVPTPVPPASGKALVRSIIGSLVLMVPCVVSLLAGATTAAPWLFLIAMLPIGCLWLPENQIRMLHEILVELRRAKDDGGKDNPAR